MDRIEQIINESYIYTNLTRIINEEAQPEEVPPQPEQEPQEPPLTQEQVIQQEMDQYGNPLGFENPLTKGIDDFAIKKAKVYDILTDKLKENIKIKN